MKGNLEESKCDNLQVFEFLKLLKKPGFSRAEEFTPITNNEWIRVVKSAKKQSVSSIFSSRTYSIYKCTLSSDRMTNILVNFYNIIIKACYYPTRWLDIIDIMIEKGKDPMLRKLQTIQLIEANLQLLIRISISNRNQGAIEKDKRVSKCNYGSRRNYNIETAILKKRLIFNNSILIGESSTYNLTDL